MADAISGKKNTQTYLRQVQQEKAKYKRELTEAQRNDMKAVRDYYADQHKQLEAEAKAAVVDIKSEARELAEQDRQQRLEQRALDAEQKQLSREQRNSGNIEQASASSVEKKNFISARKELP